MTTKSDYIIRLTELAQQLKSEKWEIPDDIDLSSDRAVNWFSHSLPSLGFDGYSEPSAFKSAMHGGTAAVNALEMAIDWSTGQMKIALTPEDIRNAGEVIASNDTQTWFRLNLITDLIDATISYFSNTNTSFGQHFEMAIERREARENYLDLKKVGLSEAEAVLLTGVRYENGKVLYSHAPLYLSTQERAQYNDYLGGNALLDTTPAEDALKDLDIVSASVAVGLIGGVTALAAKLPLVKPALHATASVTARGTMALAERIGATVQTAQQVGKAGTSTAQAAAGATRVSPILGANGQNIIVTAPQGSAALKTLELSSKSAILGVGALRFMGAASGAYFIYTGGKDTVDSLMNCRYGSAGFGAFITGGRIAYTGMAVAAPVTGGTSAVGAGITAVGVEGTKIVVNDILKITDIEGDEATKAIAGLMENDFVNPTMHYRLTNIDVLRAVQGSSQADPVYIYLREKYGQDGLALIEEDITAKSQTTRHRRLNRGWRPFDDYTLPASVADKQYLQMFSTSDALAQSREYRDFMLGELKYVNVMDGGVTFQGYRVNDVLRDLGTMGSMWGDEQGVANGKDGILVQMLRTKGFNNHDIVLLQQEAERQMDGLKSLAMRSSEALDQRFTFKNPEFYNSLSLQARESFKPSDVLALPSNDEINSYLARYTKAFTDIEQAHRERYGHCEIDNNKTPAADVEPAKKRNNRGRPLRKSSAVNLPSSNEYAALPEELLTGAVMQAQAAGVAVAQLPTQNQTGGTRVSNISLEVADANGAVHLAPSSIAGGAYVPAANALA